MSDLPQAVVESIYRYPLKGFSPERLTQVMLAAGQTLPADRRFAIENGPSGFDPARPAYFPKIKFLMLMRHERLAALATRYDEASHVLTVSQNGAEAISGNLREPGGRAAIERFIADYCADVLEGPPRLIEADGHSFSDVARKVVSLINLESVRAVGDLVGETLDPLRFRGNVHVTGWPAWHEFNLVGKTIAVGATKLKVVKRIVRCAAVNVDPKTAVRGLNLPAAMQRELGHADCGVYAEVIEGGEIGEGSAIAELQPTLI
jgi:uncharacterized protein YcbX